ncbi:MAG: transposase [Opitutae bacterium]|nr:transposase [Opitutae bacterium]
MPQTREHWRHRLPHWEVADRPHFVTIRCTGSLPSAARARIREIHASLRLFAPASPQFATLQRQYFLTCEKYLDRGEGFAPFREAAACTVILTHWRQLTTESGWAVPHFAIMPNHVHFLLQPNVPEPAPLRATVREFKGRTARQANQVLGRTGAFWQSDWFDRWVRDESEETRIVDYIRQNPVKAGLARTWQEYPWVA